MAGSLRWFDYESDDGTNWALFADESNVEAANGAAAVAGPPTGQNYKPPANLKPRYAVYSRNGGTTVRVPILTLAVYNALTTGDVIPDPFTDATNLALVRKRPEVISPLPTTNDTGIIDGDNPG
jgi:hypothetical protein